MCTFNLHRAALGPLRSFLCGCGMTAATAYTIDRVLAIQGSDPDHHQLRYQDGKDSANNSWGIKLGHRLNPESAAPLGSTRS